MKKLLLASVLAIVSTSANAWTDRWGHWHEGPYLYGPINPGVIAAPYGCPPGTSLVSGGPYGPACRPFSVAPPYAVVGPPVVVMPPPTDAEVIAGTVLGIASMFARGRGW